MSVQSTLKSLLSPSDFSNTFFHLSDNISLSFTLNSGIITICLITSKENLVGNTGACGLAGYDVAFTRRRS